MKEKHKNLEVLLKNITIVLPSEEDFKETEQEKSTELGYYKCRECDFSVLSKRKAQALQWQSGHVCSNWSFSPILKKYRRE